ncbi:putative major facilitator, sugar transporter, major facilitator superfamily [Dioscorea sansibarensis]
MESDNSTIPLLQTIYASNNLQAYSDGKTAPASLDEAIESFTGGTSKALLWQAFLASSAWIFDAQQTFINVFTDAQPAWHSTTGGGGGDATQCNLTRESWTWDHPKETSIISDWDLQCSSAAVVGLPASAFFAGCLVGGLLLATLSDSKFGRKNMLFFTSLSMSISAGLTSASPNLAIYSLLRFISGFSRATIGTNALVLSTELVGRGWREAVGIMGFLCFSLGFLSLPLMAYLVRDHSWRMLYILTFIMSLIYSIIIFFFLKESPRWLLVRGRRDEAMQTLGIKSGSGTRFSSCLDMFEKEEKKDSDVFSSMRVLWEKRWVFRRMVAAMMVGIGIGMVYYGMPLALGSLGSNLYVSVGMNALSEVPSNLLVFVLIERMSRRMCLLGFNVMSGLGCIMCVFLVRRWWRVVAEMVGFFAACSGFSMMLVYSVELFPTAVRNSAVMMVREAMVLGGVVAPMMITAGGRAGNGVVSFGVFGLVIMCFSLFVVCLPETKGRQIFDTLEEEEEKIKKISESLIAC